MLPLLITRQTPTEFTITYPIGTVLTDRTPRMDICKQDKTVVLSLTEGSGFETSISDRQITGTITSEQSEGLTVGDYIADFVLLEDGEVVDRSPAFPAKVIDFVTDVAS